MQRADLITSSKIYDFVSSDLLEKFVTPFVERFMDRVTDPKQRSPILNVAIKGATAVVPFFDLDAALECLEGLSDLMPKDRKFGNFKEQVRQEQARSLARAVACYLAVAFGYHLNKKTESAQKLATIWADRIDVEELTLEAFIASALHFETNPIQRARLFNESRVVGGQTLNGLLRKMLLLTPDGKFFIRNKPSGCLPSPTNHRVKEALKRHAVQYVSKKQEGLEEVEVSMSSDENRTVVLVGPAQISEYGKSNSGQNFKAWLFDKLECNPNCSVVFQGDLNSVVLDKKYAGMIFMDATLTKCTIQCENLSFYYSNIMDSTFESSEADDEKYESTASWRCEGVCFIGCTFPTDVLIPDGEWRQCIADKETKKTLKVVTAFDVIRDAKKEILELRKEVKAIQASSDLKSAGNHALKKRALPKIMSATRVGTGNFESEAFRDVDSESFPIAVLGNKKMVADAINHCAHTESKKSKHVIMLNAVSFEHLVDHLITIARDYFELELSKKDKEEVVTEFLGALEEHLINSEPGTKALFILQEFNRKDECVRYFFETSIKDYEAVIGASEDAKNYCGGYCQSLVETTNSEQKSTDLESMNLHAVKCALLSCHVMPKDLEEHEQKRDDQCSIEDYDAFLERAVIEEPAMLNEAITSLLDKFLEEDVFATNSTSHTVMQKNASILPSLLQLFKNIETLQPKLTQITDEQKLEMTQKLAVLYARAAHNTMQRGWFEQSEEYIKKSKLLWKTAKELRGVEYKTPWLYKSWEIKTNRYEARLMGFRFTQQEKLNEAAKRMEQAIDEWKKLEPETDEQQADYALHHRIFLQDLVVISLKQEKFATRDDARKSYLKTAEKYLGEIQQLLENLSEPEYFGWYKQNTNQARVAWKLAQLADEKNSYNEQMQKAGKYFDEAKVNKQDPAIKSTRDTLGLYRRAGEFYLKQANNENLDASYRQECAKKAIAFYHDAYSDFQKFVGGEEHPIRFEVTLAFAQAAFVLLGMLNEEELIRMLTQVTQDMKETSSPSAFTTNFFRSIEIVHLYQTIESLIGECTTMQEEGKMQLATEITDRYEQFKANFESTPLFESEDFKKFMGNLSTAMSQERLDEESTIAVSRSI